MPAGRIAVVLPIAMRPDEAHRDLLPIADGLAEIGEPVTFYCRIAAPARTPAEASVPIVVAGDQLENTDFWRAQAVDRAVVLTWLGHHRVLSALRAAGALVISKGDTDGMVSVRRHPIENWRRMTLHQPTGLAGVRATWHWMKRFGPLYAEEVASYRRSFQESHALVVETSGAREQLLDVLDVRGTEREGALEVIGNPVAPTFSRSPVCHDRSRVVAAIGRWDDPAKGGRGLARALSIVLRADSSVRMIIGGPAAPEVFRSLKDQGDVELRDRIPNADVAALIAEARVVAFGSRWEGYPIAAMEALACGCSVVGPPISAFRDIARGGGGQVAAKRGPRALATTILSELGKWDSGQRVAAQLTDTWRPLVDRMGVAERMLDVLGRLETD